MLSEISIHYKRSTCKFTEAIASPGDSVDLFRRIFDPNTIDHHEQSYALMLSQCAKPLGYVLLGSGCHTSTHMDPKTCIQSALLCHAKSVIICHNHPSGNTDASTEDMKMTKKIKEGLNLFDISLIDHIILTSDSYMSMADEGAL